MKKKFPAPHPLSAKFDALSLTLPKLGIALPEWDFASSKAYKPILEVAGRLGAQMQAVNAGFAPLLERLKWLEEETIKCQRLEAVGWLPHDSSPFHLVAEEPADPATLDAEIELHYLSNWAQISENLKAGIAACNIDEEAKAVFCEAVAAHGGGLYRCGPRLLFPEIERVARLELHGGAMDKMASQDRLRDAIGGLTPAEMSSVGVTGLRLYYKLANHLYAHVKDSAELAKVASDPVPNRHASLHGYVSYTSLKSSLNSLIVADYLLQAISTLKQLAAEDETGEA